MYLSFGVDEEGAVTWNYGTLMSTIWSELGPLCQCYMRVKVVDVSILAYNTVCKRYFCMIVYCLSEYLRSYVIIGWRNFMLLSNTLLPSHKTCVHKKRIWNMKHWIHLTNILHSTLDDIQSYVTTCGIVFIRLHIGGYTTVSFIISDNAYHCKWLYAPMYVSRQHIDQFILENESI